MSEIFLHTSDETGAPALNNAAGSLISLLDACLVNGYNSKSVIAASVTSNVCTLQVSAHGYKSGRKLLVAGASNALLNGVKKITVIDANNVSYPTTGVADGAATGTITCKRAPLGWTKAFGSTTQSLYARADITATAYQLRVDNTATTGYAKVSSVLGATDINTFTERYPTSAQTTAGEASCFWTTASSSTPVAWTLVGDGTTFYLFSYFSNTTSLRSPKGFGDLVSFKPGDTTNCFIGGDANNNSPFFLSGSAWGTSPIPIPGVSNSQAWIAHDYTGFAGSTPISNVLHGAYPIGGALSFAFPNPVDNGLAFNAQVIAMEANSFLRAVPRGKFPGVAEPLAYISATYQGIQISAGGKTYVAVVFEGNGSDATPCSALFDLTGPWQ